MRRAGKTISAKKFLTLLSGIIVVPLAIFLLVYSAISLRSFQSVNLEMAQAGQRTIEMYQLLLEQELNNQCFRIANNWVSDANHQVMLYAEEPIEQFYALDKIKETYRSMMNSSFCLRGMSLYSAANHLQNTWVSEGAYSYELTQKINAAMSDIAEHAADNLGKGFFARPIDGHHFLFRIIGYNGAYTVLMVDMDAAANYQNRSMAPGSGFLYYATPDTEPYCTNDTISAEILKKYTHNEAPYIVTSTTPNYLVTGRYSQVLGLDILYFIPYHSSITAMKNLHLILPLLSLALLAMIPLFYHLLMQSFLLPIERLSSTIHKIRSGDLNERTEEDFLVQEFCEVGTTFNRMVGEIRDLKIASYESELQKSHAQMQYLQLQLRPHFFLNCLKILYGMVEQKKYDRVQQMVLQVSVYLRSKFQDDSARISLKEELDFVENYICLQRDSMQQDVRYTEDVEASVKDCSVPVLLIQTFVENSFKYARRQGMPLEIRISAVKLPSDEGDLLDIIIQDNGHGFSSEVIACTNIPGSKEANSQSIGIANVQQRLALLYGERAMLQLSNWEHGAQVEIILPA